MLKSLILAAAVGIAPILVRAQSTDLCTGTSAAFFFSWTINLNGIENGCGLDFQGIMQGEGGCLAVTGFACQAPQGGGTIITFNQSLFCSSGAIATAVQKTYGVTITCTP